MQYNPHVTVRSRGVMEKCTYCVQRINAAKVETKLEDLDFIPDGYFETACQQACPTSAIVFGDIFDYASGNGRGSEIYRRRTSQRTYSLLAYLNTRPRTTHALRVRNPNPALVDSERKEKWEHPFHHGGDGHDSDNKPHSDDHGHGDTQEHARERGSVLSLPVLNPNQVVPV
jgi:molybdopterin-containing oxidoreductase family iron-sulfur binding subunit